MPTLTDYIQFDGRHWETGSVHNFYAYRGVTAPHTGQPMSEALLMGISGGIVFGYFSFAYEGYDPMCAILSRNTFDPWDRMLTRLGVVQNVYQTAKPDRAERKLLNTLEEGTPAIVWADYFTLPYNHFKLDDGMWGMMPLVVYGLNESEAHIADRSGVGLTISAETLRTTRARVKKQKHRFMTLEAPDFDKLPNAVSAGIWDTIKIFTEKPPKGSKKNFGFDGYKNWINLLTKSKGKQSWASVFPHGRKLFAGLLSAHERIATFGQVRCGADRHTFADFLNEASVILNRPALNEAATLFRASASEWCKLGERLLSDEVPLLGEARRLAVKRHQLFTERGQAAEVEVVETLARLDEIWALVSAEFPLSENESAHLKQQIATQVEVIRDVERQAITELQSAMLS